jgi:hypothetical protein
MMFCFFCFWICNVRHAFRMLVSDYGIMRDVWTTHLQLRCNVRCEVGDTLRAHLLSTFGRVPGEPFLHSDCELLKAHLATNGKSLKLNRGVVRWWRRQGSMLGFRVVGEGTAPVSIEEVGGGGGSGMGGGAAVR